MSEITRCPCCGDELTPGRRVLAYLAALPKVPEDRNPAAMVPRTVPHMYKALGLPPASFYKIILALEDEGLVVKDGKTKTQHLRSKATVYELTPAGWIIARRILGVRS